MPTTANNVLKGSFLLQKSLGTGNDRFHSNKANTAWKPCLKAAHPQDHRLQSIPYNTCTLVMIQPWERSMRCMVEYTSFPWLRIMFSVAGLPILTMYLLTPPPPPQSPVLRCTLYEVLPSNMSYKPQSNIFGGKSSSTGTHLGPSFCRLWNFTSLLNFTWRCILFAALVTCVYLVEVCCMSCFLMRDMLGYIMPPNCNN